MKKIGKFHVLVFFVLFSIAFFFLHRWIMERFMVPEDGTLQGMMSTFDFALIILESYAVILCVVSLTGTLISQYNNKREIYIGFTYSLSYSVILLLAFSGLTIYMSQ